MGDGAEGEVWLARSSQGAVAVKVSSSGQLNQQLRKLQHPNIVRCLDVQVDGPQCFTTMEFASGGDLLSLLRRSSSGRLCERTAARFFSQLLSGLKYIHDQGIMHLDVKPENVCLFPADSSDSEDEDNMVCKLADFGSAIVRPPPATETRAAAPTAATAAVAAAPQPDTPRAKGLPFQSPMRVARQLPARRKTISPSSVSSPVCVCGRCVRGSAAFMAPELVRTAWASCRGDPASPRSSSARDASSLAAADAWSLGVTLYVMVAGHTPWDHHHCAGAASPSAHAEPTLRFPAHFSSALCELLSGLLRTDPAARLTLEAARRHAWVQQYASEANAAAALAAVRARQPSLVRAASTDQLRALSSHPLSLLRAASTNELAASRTLGTHQPSLVRAASTNQLIEACREDMHKRPRTDAAQLSPMISAMRVVGDLDERQADDGAPLLAREIKRRALPDTPSPPRAYSTVG